METNFTRPKNINGEWKNIALTPLQENKIKEQHYNEMIETFVRCYVEARKAVARIQRNPISSDGFTLAQKFFEKTQSHVVAKMEYKLCEVADKIAAKK